MAKIVSTKMNVTFVLLGWDIDDRWGISRAAAEALVHNIEPLYRLARA